MSIRPAPVLLWLVATAAATAIASVAIGQVGRQIALEVPIDEELARAADGDAPADVLAPGAEASPAEAPPPDAGPSSAGTARTFDTIGGSAAVGVSGDALEIRWATPREGFRVSVEPSPSGRELRIDFRSEAHRSRIKVQLVDGRLVDEIEEDDR